VWHQSYLQSILFYGINSYLPSQNSSVLSFPESRDEIPFKGGSLPYPKISILECELFSLEELNFQKDFNYFSFKMILFEIIFNLKRVDKFKRFIWFLQINLFGL
jgi:hypothetical protein